jgi:hypothetical protein
MDYIDDKLKNTYDYIFGLELEDNNTVIVIDENKAINLSKVFPTSKIRIYYKGLYGYVKSYDYLLNGVLID